jgi:hypothetical protein
MNQHSALKIIAGWICAGILIPLAVIRFAKPLAGQTLLTLCAGVLMIVVAPVVQLLPQSSTSVGAPRSPAQHVLDISRTRRGDGPAGLLRRIEPLLSEPPHQIDHGLDSRARLTAFSCASAIPCLLSCGEAGDFAIARRYSSSLN